MSEICALVVTVSQAQVFRTILVCTVPLYLVLTVDQSQGI